jgi:hypothetical protein
MTNKATGLMGLLTPIWQEVSSLWSGAEFAFLDQSSYGDGEDAASAAFLDVTSMSNHSEMEAGQLGHCW